MQFMGRDRKMAWHSNQGAIGSPHELGAKSGSKLAALQTLARQGCVPKYREVFGVRPACRRFRWFMVPRRGRMVVESVHEPPNQGEHDAMKILLGAVCMLLTIAALQGGSLHCDLSAYRAQPGLEAGLTND